MSSISAIAPSGLTAATSMLNVSASNIADTAPIGEAGACDPSQVETGAAAGVVVAQAVTVKPAQLIAYVPASPLAGVRGMVDTPEIDPITKVTNQLTAGIAFAYSLAALEVTDEEQQQTLDMTA